jgi:methylisocitrate lyase
MNTGSPEERFREAVATEAALQVIGIITAYEARMAEATGLKAPYLSGGRVAANSLVIPDLGISTMEEVRIDVRRNTEVTSLPLLVDIHSGWSGAFNIARTIRSVSKAGAAAVHIEDQVSPRGCGHRPGKELVPQKRRWWIVLRRP